MLMNKIVLAVLAASGLGLVSCAGADSAESSAAKTASSESVVNPDEEGSFDAFVVERLDLDRYVGKWFEIAAIPTPQSGFCTNAQAVYSDNGDGTIKVVNSCLAGTFPVQIEGSARVVDTKSNAILAVRLGLIPGEADYRVIALDTEDYGYALVTNLQRTSLFVLSREKTLDDSILQALLARAAEAGVDVTKVRRTVQN